MREALGRSWPPLLLAVLLASGFLAAGPGVFPMDDAYIHAVYARNLAEHGVLSFNLNPPDAGLGTTSILWPLLLAGLSPLGGVIVAARLLGILAYLATVWLATLIAGWMTPGETRYPARVAGGLVALSGNLLWFSFSGMETMLWLALGLGALVAWRGHRPALAGVLLGLQMLTRIEGVILLAALLAVELWRRRRVTRSLLVTTALALALLAPWLAYVHRVTGEWLPTSYEGKQHAQIRGAVQTVREVGGDNGEMIELEEERLPAWVALVYPLAALSYGVAFVAGAAYLPGPRVPLAGSLGTITGGLSVTGFLVFLGLFAPLFWVAGRRAVGLCRGGLDERRGALLILGLWFLGHNLAYWLKLPTPGTASRYQVVNHLAWWLLAGVATWRLRPARQWPVAGLLLFLALLNTGYWFTVYGSNLRHMRQVRLAAAEWVRAELPPDAVVAAHDIGALGWGMARRCIDLGGLIDPGWLEAAKDERQAGYLREHRARYLILPTKHSTEREGFFDYAEFLGLKDNPAVPLTPLRRFEGDWHDWRRGAAPTWNALAGVTIYRIGEAP